MKGANNDHFIILYFNVYSIWETGTIGNPGGVGDIESFILSGVSAAVLNYTCDFGTGLYSTSAFARWSAGQFCGGEGMNTDGQSDDENLIELRGSRRAIQRLPFLRTGSQTIDFFTDKGDNNAKENQGIRGGLSMATYEILHGEKIVASITLQGECEIFLAGFMPCNLYLEETEELDGRVNNVTNFYYWCATRVLTLDRKYAKQILNSIGMGQAVTDKERAQVALAYHCLSLTDIYWVRTAGEAVSYAEINLYENHLSNAFVDVSLRGRQMTVHNAHLLAGDTSTGGCFPKAWIREADGFYLLKDGDAKAVERELLASRICRCFCCNQVFYESFAYDGLTVSKSRLMTSLRYSIVSREAFEVYAVNHEIDVMQYLLKLDAFSFYMMNILDYLVGNTDRHWGNWGLLMDNETGEMLRLHDLMDFNQAFSSYDSEDGAGCQTIPGRRITQREAALEAVRQIGVNQVAEVDSAWFSEEPDLERMFRRRLAVLYEAAEE